MYLDDKEKVYKASINERIARENILEVEYVISDGNRCNIYHNGKGILMLLTLEQAYYVVHGILNYENVRG